MAVEALGKVFDVVAGGEFFGVFAGGEDGLELFVGGSGGGGRGQIQGGTGTEKDSCHPVSR